MKQCPCGSGKKTHWQIDRDGVPMGRMCDDCKATVLAYRQQQKEAEQSCPASATTAA